MMGVKQTVNLFLISLNFFFASNVVSGLDKFTQFSSLPKSLLPIQLDDSSYNEIVSDPRDYHVAILLTAVEARYGCQLCRDMQPEWDLLAKSWNKASHPSTRLLFGTLDFDQGKAVFQKLILQTAPVLLLFPPTVGPAARQNSSPLRYDFNGPVSADQLYTWISRHLPESPSLDIVRPVNYTRILGITTSLLCLISIFAASSPYILPVVRNRTIWAAMSLIALLLFTSGHMFNHIRKVPYVTGDGKGGITYFASGFSNQFGLESQIIAAIYGLLSFTIIALATKTPQIVDTKAQQASVVIWSIILLGMYSFLMSIFRAKSGGYPFFLPPF
ncbi:oligosaccharyl transferase subunit ost3/OST6 [Coccidioides posadasii str. Silveira]|nr:oligosaccharyl transferase subunit ost3/OST6 [Coccidioides posadasii str. Silveira]